MNRALEALWQATRLATEEYAGTYASSSAAGGKKVYVTDNVLPSGRN